MPARQYSSHNLLPRNQAPGISRAACAKLCNCPGRHRSVQRPTLHDIWLVCQHCFQRRLQATDIFVCDEESHFYSQCLEKLLVKNSSGTQTVVEFGSGDGTPVIACLMHSQFSGTIHGFELNKRAADLANSRAIQSQVSKHYKVSLQGFTSSAHWRQLSTHECLHRCCH